MNKQEQEPLVSVIVPVYNSEKYIERCIRSLTEQDFGEDYEILVINDGSKDSSMDTVNRFAVKYGNIRVVNQQNRGVAAARNTGIEKARGEYVAFVDSDDFVEASYISKLYAAALHHNADIVHCNYRNTNARGGRLFPQVIRHRKGVFSGEKLFRQSLMDMTIRGYLWNKLYRRSLFTENNITFPVGMHFEDFAIMPRLHFFAKNVVFINDVLYNYVHHSASITGNITTREVYDYLKAYASLRPFMEEQNIFPKNRFTYCLLRKKVSVTVFGILIRCQLKKPKDTHVLSSYSRSCKILKLYSTDKYYYASPNNLEIQAFK